MNPNVAFEILELALSLLKSPGANSAATLVRIVGKAVQAYQDHTGQPLDPSLIKAEDPV